MLIVADSSALIALAVCDGLDILLRVYEDVRVPRAVFDEVTGQKKPEAAALAFFLVSRVVEVDTTNMVLAAGGLGRGEIEAMALYKQLTADALLIDDHRAREIAKHNNIHCIGRSWGFTSCQTKWSYRPDQAIYSKIYRLIHLLQQRIIEKSDRTCRRINRPQQPPPVETRPLPRPLR
jgi:predicted nucleic acid-binding protein